MTHPLHHNRSDLALRPGRACLTCGNPCREFYDDFCSTKCEDAWEEREENRLRHEREEV